MAFNWNMYLRPGLPLLAMECSKLTWLLTCKSFSSAMQFNWATSKSSVSSMRCSQFEFTPPNDLFAPTGKLPFITRHTHGQFPTKGTICVETRAKMRRSVCLLSFICIDASIERSSLNTLNPLTGAVFIQTNTAYRVPPGCSHVVHPSHTTAVAAKYYH